MILRISYNVLRGFLSNKGYRDRDIVRSVRRLRMADSDLKEAFILFFPTFYAGFPSVYPVF